MIQIVKQTHEEEVAMYMKLPKKQIIEMLIECNRQLNIAIEHSRLPVAQNTYVYFVDFSYKSRYLTYDGNNIVQFDNIKDVTIDNVKRALSGSEYSNYEIKKVTKLT